MGDVIRSFIFNSRMLIPWPVAEKYLSGDVDAIMDWVEKNQGSYRFSNDEPVADKSNLRQKMHVRRIVWQNRKVGERTEKRIVGIECYWWITPDKIISEDIENV